MASVPVQHTVGFSHVFCAPCSENSITLLPLLHLRQLLKNKLTNVTNVSCSDLGRGHPTCFSHWDILKNQLMRTTLLKEGNCACALCQCTCGKKKHITQTLLWRQRVTRSLISVQFYPVHKPLLYECKDLQPHLTVPPTPTPRKTGSAEGCGVFYLFVGFCFTTYILHFGCDTQVNLFLFMNKYSV